MTRAEGLVRLEAALPDLGRHYAAHRNAAPTPGDLPTTSRLSPWLRRRLITEEEVIAAAIAMHGAAAAGKFVQEVYWRTYFKGFLEQHPSAWTRYLNGLDDARTSEGAVRQASRAEAGGTGIACFDAWANELRDTGWLHNHVRMWFASIWIFTLRLPWQLGADFFARELIDFDPASNTLSWRWVAGLHTRGKAYTARAENIQRYTQGAFNPAGQLNESPTALEEPAAPPHEPLPTQQTLPDGPYCLLLHEDDLCPETLRLPSGLQRIAVIDNPTPAAARQRNAATTASEDARTRAGNALDCPSTRLTDVGSVVEWASGLPIVMPYAPVGPVSTSLAQIPATRLIREWDRTWWPHCGRGYFQLKDRIGRPSR